MAELRLTGPTEDGDALRLSGPEGEEHTLPSPPICAGWSSRAPRPRTGDRPRTAPRPGTT